MHCIPLFVSLRMHSVWFCLFCPTEAHHTKCPMCPQRFECFDILMRHYVEAHISEFADALLHSTHIRSIHPSCQWRAHDLPPLLTSFHWVAAQNTESSGERYYCTECYKDYPSWELLKDHISLIHSGTLVPTHQPYCFVATGSTHHVSTLQTFGPNCTVACNRDLLTLSSLVSSLLLSWAQCHRGMTIRLCSSFTRSSETDFTSVISTVYQRIGRAAHRSWQVSIQHDLRLHVLRFHSTCYLPLPTSQNRSDLRFASKHPFNLCPCSLCFSLYFSKLQIYMDYTLSYWHFGVIVKETVRS